MFWEDRWIEGRSIAELVPLLYNCIPKRRRKVRTVADGLQEHRWASNIQDTLGIPEIGQYLLLWKWTTSGVYSAHSAYLATFQSSISCRAWKITWKR